MKLLNLRDIQTSGLTLIEASAGTGKTWTITALYILLVLEQRMRPEEILVVTYTRAATAELRDRIRKRIVAVLDLYASQREPVDELEQTLLESRTIDAETARKLLTRALYTFDDAAIFTIHGFCQRALLENAFESGSLFDTELTADQSALIAQACDDFWRTRIMTDEGPFLERLINDGYTPDRLAAPFEGQYLNPALRVIPESDDPDLGELMGQRDALLPPVAAMWAAERETIIQQLNQAGLSQTSYKPERIRSAALGLDALLTGGAPRRGWDRLGLFTEDKIDSGMKKGSTRPDHPFFGLCQRLQECADLLEQGYSHKLFQRQRALRDWVRQELARRKQALNLRGYDDLLLDLYLALEGDGGERLAGGLRQRYRAALIDEFQDTDPLQWRIFARLAGLHAKPVSDAGHGGQGEATQAYTPVGRGASDEANTEMRPTASSYPLFLIGDPKQAIYSFRGADIHAYIAAALSTGLDRRWTLETNRRSSDALVRAVNTLFTAQDDPFLTPAIRFSDVKSGRPPRQQLLHNGIPETAPLRFWVHRRSDQTRAAAKGPARQAAVSATAAEIARLLDGSREIIGKDGLQRPLGPGDIAVLVKAHYQADQIQDALNALGIPSVQHGSATIFETREALDLLCILRAAADPGRSALVREALLTSTIGLSANEVFGLLSDEDAWEVWLLRFRALHEAARAGGVIALASRLLGECGVRRHALSQTGGERRLTNILHCCELLHQAEQEHGPGLEGSITWLERRITGRQDDETALLRLETDAHAVTLSTIHASKGLEYPVVFLPFAWDPPSSRNSRVLFHDDDGTLTLDLGSDQREEHRQKAREEQAAEAARLLYVAATRAEFLCYLVWGNINGAYGAPLARLLHGTCFKDARAFAAVGDQEILEAIGALAARTGRGDAAQAIAAQFMPAGLAAPPYRPHQDSTVPPTCREMRGTIPADWRVSSFSGMVVGAERHLQPRDYDAIPLSAPSQRPPLPGESVTGPSIFDFPCGAAAGTCLHELFEQLDFSAATDETLERLCRTGLQRNGYDLRWLPAVQQMVRNVITTPLLPADPGFSLSRLAPGSWLVELEFLLPLGRLSGQRLRELFEGLLDRDRHGEFAQLLASLQLQETRGMLQGFMDMVFEHAGRYYIIDWKSNHLGHGRDEYRPEQLREPMASHAYILQYHLYTLALDRLLRLRLPGYDYETHFGGAIYVFLRGISPDDPLNGIYRDRPSTEFIRRANGILLAGPEPATGGV